MSLEKNLENAKPKIISLLKQKSYSCVLEYLNRISSAYMLNLGDYDRFNFSPYDNEVSDKYNMDYINASFVNLGDKEFIACQEPKVKDHHIFVEMVKKSGFKTILSLKPNVKYFSKYIPLSVEYVKNGKGEVFITNETFDIDGSMVRRIVCEKWPDHGIMSFDDIRNLSDYVEKFESKKFIIHCMAGVGRTGTFIIFDYLKNKPKVSCEDFAEILISIRCSRPHMVETEVQLEALCVWFIKEDS